MDLRGCHSIFLIYKVTLRKKLTLKLFWCFLLGQFITKLNVFFIIQESDLPHILLTFNITFLHDFHKILIKH